MRIAVTGSSVAIPGLRGNLQLAGFRVVALSQSPTYRVVVDDASRPHVVVDIPDARFGRLVTHAVAALMPHGGVYVQHGGGNRDDRTVVLTIPIGDDAAALAVERGVVRALTDLLALTPEVGETTGDLMSSALAEWRAWRDRPRWWQWRFWWRRA